MFYGGSAIAGVAVVAIYLLEVVFSWNHDLGGVIQDLDWMFGRQNGRDHWRTGGESDVDGWELREERGHNQDGGDDDLTWDTERNYGEWKREPSNWMSEGEGNSVKSEDKRNGQRFCGRKLVDTLSMLCNQTFSKRKRGKRDSTSEPKESKGGSGGLWRDRRQAVAIMSRPRRHRGVVDECCRRPCRINELAEYCGGSS